VPDDDPLPPAARVEAPAPVPVRLARKEAPAAPVRPQIQRVARPVPEPELVEDVPAEPEAAEEPVPDVTPARRGVLGRMVDAVRGRPAPAPAAPPASVPAPPSDAPRAAASSIAARQVSRTPAPPRAAAPTPAASPALATRRSAPRGIARSAAATAPALAEHPHPRPALSLVPTPEPAPAPTPAPRGISRTGVEELASAGGGQVTQQPDGMASIDFTDTPSATPYVPFSTAPMTVSRDLLGDVRGAATNAASGLRDRATSEVQNRGHQLADQAADYAHHQVERGESALHDAIGGGGNTSDEAAKKAEADAMYDEVVRRLKLDMLVELEAGGHNLRFDP
jgi:hypothetical protein